MTNDVVEELQRRSVETCFPLETPTIDDLVKVQEELLLTLPAIFRDFLLNCGDIIYGQYEPATIADPHSHTYLTELSSRAWEQGLSREYIAFCTAENGWYCVSQSDEIHLWQKSTRDIEFLYDDIWQWGKYIWLKD